MEIGVRIFNKTNQLNKVDLSDSVRNMTKSMRSYTKTRVKFVVTLFQ